MSLREFYIRKKGKGNALNEGLCHARNDLVCILDADCVLQEDALSKAVKHFRNDEVVAVGGRLLVKREDSCQLEAIQSCEYMKTFQISRSIFARLNAQCLISGAFGVFRKSTLLGINGYDIDTVGEDMELVLRLQEKNASTWDNYYNMDELPDEKYQKFRKVYKNLSLNDEVFELRCFERYFYVLEYCKRMKLDRIILCDSDLLIYKNLTQYFAGKIRAFSHTLSEPEGMAISPHCSLWSLGDLELFVNFLIDYYNSDIEYLVTIIIQYRRKKNLIRLLENLGSPLINRCS